MGLPRHSIVFTVGEEVVVTGEGGGGSNDNRFLMREWVISCIVSSSWSFASLVLELCMSGELSCAGTRAWSFCTDRMSSYSSLYEAYDGNETSACESVPYFGDIDAKVSGGKRTYK